jgi:hypothetical protein
MCSAGMVKERDDIDDDDGKDGKRKTKNENER